MPIYEDFFVTIDGVVENYTVEARGPSGTLVGPLPFLYNETEELRQQLNTLKAGHPPVPQMMVAIGSILYRALFTRLIYGLWRTWHQDQTNLRLKLNVRPPELTDLPWELLYDPDDESFLAARLSCPIVRYIESDTPVVSSLRQGPIRVLYVQANPFDTAPLDLNQSEKAISTALGEKGDITVVRETSPARLREALRERPGFDILHYDGHGKFLPDRGEGYLALHNEKGKTNPLSGQLFADYLNGTTVRLVVLAACETGVSSNEKRFSGIAQRLMRVSNLPAAVAMQFAIPDNSAIQFVSEFYKALADNFPVDAAVIEGRKALLSHDRGLSGHAKADWVTPVLFMRSEDGYLLRKKLEELANTSDANEANSSQASQGGISFGDHASVSGDVFTIDKQVVEIDGGDFVDGDKITIHNTKFMGSRLIWLAVVLIMFGVLALVSVQAYDAYIDSLPAPIERMTGQFNIAVAPFNVYGEGREVQRAQEFAENLAITIQNTTNELSSSFGDRIKVRPPRQVNPLKGETEVELTHSASELAKKINANVVIYGSIKVEDWKVIITPQFYINDQKHDGVFEVNEISSNSTILPLSGQYRMGEEIPLESLDKTDRDYAENRLQKRLHALTFIINGLSHYLSGKYEKSTEAFQNALDQNAWDNSNVLYILLGNAELKLKHFSEARGYYEEALKLNETYPRAYIGRGIISYAEVFQAAEISGYDAIDFDKLDKAIEDFESALDLSENQPELANIRIKAYFPMGQAHLLKGLKYFYHKSNLGNEEWTKATNAFQNVIDDYQEGDDEIAQELAAHSYARIGFMQKKYKRLQDAKTSYQDAIELLPPRKRNYADIAGYEVVLGDVYAQLGQPLEAIQWYEKAIHHAAVEDKPGYQAKLDEIRKEEK